MSTTLTLVRVGFVPGFAWRIVESAALAFPIALAATLVLRPAVRVIVRRVTTQRPETTELPH